MRLFRLSEKQNLARKGQEDRSAKGHKAVREVRGTGRCRKEKEGRYE